MYKHTDLEWTEYKRGFRALTKHGNCWIEWSEKNNGFEVTYENTSAAEIYTNIHDAKTAAQLLHKKCISIRLANGNTTTVSTAPKLTAIVSLQEVSRTLNELLKGDNLPERIAINTADLKQILDHLNNGATTTISDRIVETFINAMPFDEIRHARRASIKSALTLTADMHFSKEKI